MDLFGLTRIIGLGGKRYGLVIIDDFSRFTWIIFLVHKDKIFSIFTKFHKKILNKKRTFIIPIYNDHGTKFVNHDFENFYNENGINHNFLYLRYLNRFEVKFG